MADTEASLPALAPARVAVITGAASGIGLATARLLAARRMKVVLADRNRDDLERAAGEVAAIALAGDGEAGDAMAVACDVSRPEELERLAEAAFCTLRRSLAADEQCRRRQQSRQAVGERRRLARADRGQFLGRGERRRGLCPAHAGARQTGLIVNTGSKQGITTPPATSPTTSPRSALKTYTEGLAHELRNIPGCRLSAHLLIPGFTYTGLTTGADRKAGRRLDGRAGRRLHAGAPGARRLLHSLPRQREPREPSTSGAWPGRSATSSRTARRCSRWHPDYKDAFQAFVAADDRR